MDRTCEQRERFKKKHDLQGNTYLQLETVENIGTYTQERRPREFNTHRQM